ncbi:MAG: HAD family hydrolase, partial [Halobacteriales archaeon]|nr:HAD family hydrolase [Halobacteriales archaeon]
MFFDLMGTLVDEDSDLAAHELLMRQVRDRFRLEDSAADLLGEYHLLGSDQFEEERGAGKRRTPSFTRAYTATFVAMMGKRGFLPSGEDEAWFHEAYFACHRQRVKLTPHAQAVLAKVRGLGAHVGLISDVDKVLLEDHLDFLGLRGAFDSVTSAEAARALKPDPQVFAFAMRQAGCAPREALMVGDSLE